MDSIETLNLLKTGQLKGEKRLRLPAGLREFPQEILELADSLELLDLSGNRLSVLPDDFGRLKKLKIAFFNNNAFEVFPSVLAECPALEMISFKSNQLRRIDEKVLSPKIRWLILTNNQLETLPADIGELGRLQKLMLAGNRLSALPEAMANCKNLELIRLSANRLEHLPQWLMCLPRLAWIAYAGNPVCDVLGQAAEGDAALPIIKEENLAQGEILGQGASGVIYQGVWSPAGDANKPGETGPQAPKADSVAVAIKRFKGDITSDGLPLDEMQACIAAGEHPNLVKVLGKLAETAETGKGLVFEVIPPDYENLGGPPDLDSCTRDTYGAETDFSLPVVLRVARGIASAIAHLHQRGIMHGDLYAHNILLNAEGKSFLGDFGAASFYDINSTNAQALVRLEVRAFGCLLEDLLNHCCVAQTSAASISEKEATTVANLRQLQAHCVSSQPELRPLFSSICQQLAEIALD